MRLETEDSTRPRCTMTLAEYKAGTRRLTDLLEQPRTPFTARRIRDLEHDLYAFEFSIIRRPVSF